VDTNSERPDSRYLGWKQNANQAVSESSADGAPGRLALPGVFYCLNSLTPTAGGIY